MIDFLIFDFQDLFFDETQKILTTFSQKIQRSHTRRSERKNSSYLTKFSIQLQRLSFCR